MQLLPKVVLSAQGHKENILPDPLSHALLHLVLQGLHCQTEQAYVLAQQETPRDDTLNHYVFARCGRDVCFKMFLMWQTSWTALGSCEDDCIACPLKKHSNLRETGRDRGQNEFGTECLFWLLSAHCTLQQLCKELDLSKMALTLIVPSHLRFPSAQAKP